MLKMLKHAGVLVTTGMMSIVGFVTGLMLFTPENVSFNAKSDKEKGAK